MPGSALSFLLRKLTNLAMALNRQAASTVQPKDGAAYMLRSPVSAIFVDTLCGLPTDCARMIAHQREETINDRRENIAVFL